MPENVGGGRQILEEQMDGGSVVFAEHYAAIEFAVDGKSGCRQASGLRHGASQRVIELEDRWSGGSDPCFVVERHQLAVDQFQGRASGVVRGAGEHGFGDVADIRGETGFRHGGDTPFAGEDLDAGNGRKRRGEIDAVAGEPGGGIDAVGDGVL